MTREEFSNEFDVLYNNIRSEQAPGLDEYEKSVFLTKAQNEIIKNYFNPKGNKYQEGFDGSSKRQIDFSSITMQSHSSLTVPTQYSFFDGISGAYQIQLPTDTFVIINEVVDVISLEGAKRRLQIIPIKYDDYTRLNSKPYKQPLKNQAWRLIFENHSAYVVIGHNYNPSTNGYKIRYVRRPRPIILENLTNNLTIDGVSSQSECELDKELHPEILQRAVELAKIAYEGDVNQSQLHIQTGQRSE